MVEFPTRLLNFSDDISISRGDAVSSYWMEYFNDRHTEAPVGQMGSHPNDFVKSSYVEYACTKEYFA
jgi:hypothetical protein